MVKWSEKSDIKTEKWKNRNSPSIDLKEYFQKKYPGDHKELTCLILGENKGHPNFLSPIRIEIVDKYVEKMEDSERIVVLINNEWIGNIWMSNFGRGNYKILSGFIGYTLPKNFKKLRCFQVQWIMARAEDVFDLDSVNLDCLKVEHTLIIN